MDNISDCTIIGDNYQDTPTLCNVMPYLTTERMGREIIYFDIIDSTNNAARDMAKQGCAEGLVVTAESQDAGRGRLGRAWVTPPGTSIAFSLVLRPDIKLCDVPGITLVMGTAVCRAIRSITSLDAGIKWPNDIVINGRKVCGILTEMSGDSERVDFIVAGVGINVNVGSFPREIGEVATSLMLEKRAYVSRCVVLASVLNEFERLYEDFKTGGIQCILDEFKGYSRTLGNHVKVQSVNEAFEGTAVDITERGLLAVRLCDGSIRHVISGDVLVRGINGYV